MNEFRHILTLLLITLFTSQSARAQVAPRDSLRSPYQGVKTIRTGDRMMLSGAAMAAAGGGLILLVSRANQAQSVEECREDMRSAFAIIAGYGLVFCGAGFSLAGIPVTVAGRGMMNARDPWRQARYDGDAQRGFGLILEGGGFAPFVQGRVTAGYHYNQHFFLGGGAALTYDFDRVNGSDLQPLEMPVYADVRFSAGSKLLAPYAGLTAGYDLLDRQAAFSANLGLRIRLSQESTRSMWMALMGEVSAWYYRAGLKMGYSF